MAEEEVKAEVAEWLWDLEENAIVPLVGTK